METGNIIKYIKNINRIPPMASETAIKLHKKCFIKSEVEELSYQYRNGKYAEGI